MNKQVRQAIAAAIARIMVDTRLDGNAANIAEEAVWGIAHALGASMEDIASIKARAAEICEQD
jgi:hypothetical protein